MGIWDYISSTTNSLKQSTPDLTPVKNICQSSYKYICATVSKMDQVVRVNAVDKLNQHLPDQESRSQFAVNVVKNATIFACLEAFKYVPGGGPLYRIASKSFGDVKKFEDPKKEMKKLKSKVDRLEKEVNVCRKLLEQPKMHKQNINIKSQNKSL